MARQTQVTEPKKRRGASPERMREINKLTRWKKGQSGNPAGPLGEKAVSEGLRKFYGEHPKEFERLLNAAHRKASARKPHPKFWELVVERVEGKVSQQVDVRALVIHSATESERKTAFSTIESIRAFESSAENPIQGELVEENEKQSE